MKPSDFSTSSTRPRIVAAGVTTVSRRRIWALRMRVSISAIGSVRLICLVSLPAPLYLAGHLPEIAELTQGDTAQFHLAVEAARPAGQFATVANTTRRRIARQLGELELGGETLFHADLLILGEGLQLGALVRVLLAQLPAAGVLLDRAGLCHVSSSAPYCLLGKLKALSSARAASSVFAVVHTMMSMPQTCSIWSLEISGKMM